MGIMTLDYEHTKRGFLHQLRSKVPDLQPILPYFFFVGACVMIGFGIRNAFLTSGEVADWGVYLTAGSILVSLAGVIAGVVSFGHRLKHPWVPIIGILLNLASAAAVLAIIVMGIG